MTQADVKTFQTGIDSVPRDYVPVVPDDNTDLTYVARGIYNGGAAAVTVVCRTVDGGGTSRTLAIPAYTILPGLFTRVLATGTTGGATLFGVV